MAETAFWAPWPSWSPRFLQATLSSESGNFQETNDIWGKGGKVWEGTCSLCESARWGQRGGEVKSENVLTDRTLLFCFLCPLWNKCLQPLPTNATPDRLTPRSCARGQPVQTVNMSMKRSLLFFSEQGDATGTAWKKPEKQDQKNHNQTQSRESTPEGWDC